MSVMADFAAVARGASFLGWLGCAVGAGLWCSRPLAVLWWGLFSGFRRAGCRFLGSLGCAAGRRCGLLVLLLHGPPPLAGFRAGVRVPPSLLWVSWGVLWRGDSSRFSRALRFGGAYASCSCLALLRGWARSVALLFAVVDHFGVPACSASFRRATPPSRARPFCRRVCACLARFLFSRRRRLIVGLAGDTLCVTGASARCSLVAHLVGSCLHCIP